MDSHFYCRSGKRDVRGWFTRVDAEIFSTLLGFQEKRNVIGGCCEIGVHQGKSFIPLCLSLKNDERALCIDVFENQRKNIDASGRGDRERLIGNLNRFGVDLRRVRLLAESSDNVTPGRICEEVGPVRFFSIDGGHWRSIVQNDLSLAEDSLTHCGVIALDDAFRAEWPDVTLALASWLGRTKTKIVPFACGTNKLYLCHAEFASAYRESLRTNFLGTFYAKTYRSNDFELDSYKTEIVNWDEADFGEVVRSIAKAFFPDFLFKLKTAKVTVKRLLSRSKRPHRTTDVSCRAD